MMSLAAAISPLFGARFVVGPLGVELARYSIIGVTGTFPVPCLWRLMMSFAAAISPRVGVRRNDRFLDSLYSSFRCFPAYCPRVVEAQKAGGGAPLRVGAWAECVRYLLVHYSGQA